MTTHSLFLERKRDEAKKMPKAYWFVTIVVMACALVPLFGNGTTTEAAGFPGSDPFDVTKLEWACLEMQVLFGHEHPVDRSGLAFRTFNKANNGGGVICVLVFSSKPEDDGAAEEALVRQLVNMYKEQRSFDWLELTVAVRHF